MTDKDAVISKIYYDVNGGFGSLPKTLAKAKNIDPTITYNDVKSFLDKQVVRQKTKPNRYNSYVPQFPHTEYQVDLADFGAGGKFRYAMLCTDIFTKMLAVVQLTSKASKETAKALDVVIQKLGIPVTVMTDEGGEFLADFENRLKYYDIEHLVTRTPPIFVERIIRTLKEKIDRRLEATQMDRTNWWRFLDPVVAQYNNETHTTIGMTPQEATDPDKTDKIRNSIIDHAIHNRNYPNLHVGDMVKVIRKPGKYSEYKTGFNAWGEETFRVEDVIISTNGLNMYKLEGRPRPLLRHELLRVEGVQRPPLLRVTGKQSTGALLQRTSQPAAALPTEPKYRISGKQSEQQVQQAAARLRQASKVAVPPTAGVAVRPERPASAVGSNLHPFAARHANIVVNRYGGSYQIGGSASSA